MQNGHRIECYFRRIQFFIIMTKKLLCSVELVDSGLSVTLVVHGDEGVALLGDVDVGDGSELGELLLEKILGA